MALVRNDERRADFLRADTTGAAEETLHGGVQRGDQMHGVAAAIMLVLPPWISCISIRYNTSGTHSNFFIDFKKLGIATSF